PQAQPAPAALPAKGEKAFLFQTSGADRKPAAPGNVVWSAIEVEPATGGAADMAIRADLSVPRDGLMATITLRRNLDRSLPATHIAEIVFAVADGFEGGAIKSVEGINFLQAARGASEPLIGSTVDIAEGIFLFALSDAPAASPRNIQLLSHPDLIEIPVVYTNGQRATLRLVAGKTGAQAFAAALDDWGVPVLPEPESAPRPEPATPAAERLAPQAAAPEPEQPDEPEVQATGQEAPAEEPAAPTRVVLPVTGPIPVDRPLPF
ncbi:MAG: hypothetical protein WAU86_15875, partial [Oricola sp.]